MKVWRFGGSEVWRVEGYDDRKLGSWEAMRPGG